MAVKLAGISHEFKSGGHTNQVLRNVSFTVEDGEILALVGKSGCGKSTLLNIVASLLTATEGTVSVTKQGNTDSTGNRLAYAFQSSRLLPWRTALDNIMIPLASTERDKKMVRMRAEKYLALVGLSDAGHKYPGELSGGMQQRTAIARAVAVEPAALLMDEPFSSVDEFTARTLRSEFVRIATSLNQTVLFVTHNVREAVYIADRIIILTSNPGEIAEEVNVPLQRPREMDSIEIEEIANELLLKLESAQAER